MSDPKTAERVAAAVERHKDTIAEMLALIWVVPTEDRMDTMAAFTAAVVQSKMLAGVEPTDHLSRRADASLAPALAAHNREAGDTIAARQEEAS